jgi:hypothetical protein
VFDKNIYDWNSTLDYGDSTDFSGVIHKYSMIFKPLKEKVETDWQIGSDKIGGFSRKDGNR